MIYGIALSPLCFFTTLGDTDVSDFSIAVGIVFSCSYLYHHFEEKWLQKFEVEIQPIPSSWAPYKDNEVSATIMNLK